MIRFGITLSTELEPMQSIYGITADEVHILVEEYNYQWSADSL